MIEDRKKEILMAVLDNYLQSGDFNGMDVAHLTKAGDVELIKELIADGRLDLTAGGISTPRSTFSVVSAHMLSVGKWAAALASSTASTANFLLS